MITLIIVDCQNDFITGTMSVKGAKKALENIKTFIKNKREDIERIIFTADWHPYNHCSFKRVGGLWPHHCIQFTPGACIEPKLLKYVQSKNIPYKVCLKGIYEEKEEYGAFSEIVYINDVLGERYYLDDTLPGIDINTEFIVCGIAGDYCVKETINNLLKGDIIPKVLLSGIASIDGGKVINEFIKENHLEKV